MCEGQEQKIIVMIELILKFCLKSIYRCSSADKSTETMSMTMPPCEPAKSAELCCIEPPKIIMTLKSNEKSKSYALASSVRYL